MVDGSKGGYGVLIGLIEIFHRDHTLLRDLEQVLVA